MNDVYPVHDNINIGTLASMFMSSYTKELTVSYNGDVENYYNFGTKELCIAIHQHPSLKSVYLKGGRRRLGVSSSRDDESDDGTIDDDNSCNQQLFHELTTIPNLKQINLASVSPSWTHARFDRLVSHPSLATIAITTGTLNDSQLLGIRQGLERRNSSSTTLSNLWMYGISFDSTETFVNTTLETAGVKSVRLYCSEEAPPPDSPVAVVYCDRIGESIANNRVVPKMVSLNYIRYPIPIMKGLALNNTTTLQSISISFDVWTKDVGRLLSKVLSPQQSRDSSLKKLKLTCDKIEDPKYDWNDCLACSSSFGSHSKLEELGVLVRFSYSGNKNYNPVKAVERFCQSTTLKKVVFPGWPSGKEYIQCISMLIQSETPMEVFEFRHCKYIDKSNPKFKTKEEYYEALEISRNSHIAFQCSSRWKELNTICKLNKNGPRRYLFEGEPQNNKKLGVDVLIGVNDDLDALYFHLLENPNLCNKACV